jgi:hypothetical protein
MDTSGAFSFVIVISREAVFLLLPSAVVLVGL